MDLSIIVVFYNMAREARRALTALSRAYQRGVEGLTYEVICIDNGSNPPLLQDMVESFGPEFRLIRPAQPLPSPCKAINDAAAQAKGDYLAVMIDGAHVVTPGVLRAAMDARASDPGAVVAVRGWFIGGDQRWLGENGYTPQKEDPLFEQIKWPANGYDLFRIGAPIDETSNPWFSSMNESNCLFMPAALYREIGGFDERFDEPGAGFANLDLFRRATDAGAGPIVSLLGEASFHQFHGGTTTNATVAAKDRLVSEYRAKYRRLKGRAFSSVKAERMTFRGRMTAKSAFNSAERPTFPAPVPLTEALRGGHSEGYLDTGRRSRLLSAYGEDWNRTTTTWLGQSVNLFPADLVAIQELLARTRPNTVVLIDVEAGLIAFVASILKLTDNPARVIWVGDATQDAGPASPAVTTIVGDSGDASVNRALSRAVGACGRTCVLVAPRPSARFNHKTLLPFARLVSPNFYFVVLRTVLGQPWIGYSKHNTRGELRRLRRMDPGLAIDSSWSYRHLLTACPEGFMIRRASSAEIHDPALNDLTALGAPR